MQDADLLVQLAGIAGVFVGFGALISVRSGGPSDAQEVAYIRYVVSFAIWVVVAALAPVTLSRYGLTGHGLWLVGSLLALLFLVGVSIVNVRTPEVRADYAARWSRVERIRMAATYQPAFILMVTLLALVALGRFPDQEPAFYLTALVLGLLLTALTLLDLVFSQRRPQPAPDPPAPAAAGGSAG